MRWNWTVHVHVILCVLTSFWMLFTNCVPKLNRVFLEEFFCPQLTRLSKTCKDRSKSISATSTISPHYPTDPLLHHNNNYNSTLLCPSQLYLTITHWARTPSKMPGVNNFLSFYSIILKLGTKKKTRHSLKSSDFVFEI